MLWLAAYLMGFPPTGLYTLRWTHGLTPMWLYHANAQLSLLDPFNEVEYLKQDSLKEPEIT